MAVFSGALLLTTLTAVSSHRVATADPAPAPDVTAGGFVPVTPTRVLDTRSGLGGTTGPVAPGQVVHVGVSGTGGIPTYVAAVAMTVTVTQPTSSGHLTVWPADLPAPDTSNLNFQPGDDVANLVVVQTDAGVGADGIVDVVNATNGGTSQIVIDLAGYYPAPPFQNSNPSDPVPPLPPGGFQTVTPTRVLDTRSGTGAPAGPAASGASIAVTVAGHGGVPAAGVAAVAVTVTATQAQTDGHLTIAPDGQTLPDASNLNFVAGRDVANTVVVPVGSDGAIRLLNASNGGTTQLIVDVAGWFAGGDVPMTGGLVGLPPVRVLDTRAGLGAPAGAVTGGSTVTLKVAGRGGVPTTGVSAVAVTVTATQSTSTGHVTVFPGGSTVPNVSNINLRPEQDVADLVVVPVGPDGTIRLLAAVNNGSTQLVADIAGYTVGASDPDQWLTSQGALGDTMANLGEDTLTTFDVTRTDPAWSVPTNGYGPAPVVDDGVVYSAAYAVDALDAKTGAILWSAPAPDLAGTATGQIVLTGRTLVVGFDGNRGPSVAAYSLDSHRLVWWQPVVGSTDATPDTSIDGLAVDDGRVFVLAEPVLNVLDVATGTVQRTAGDIGAVDAVDGVLYESTSTTGLVEAVDPSNGDLLWRSAPGQGGSLSVAGGRVFSGSGDGVIAFAAGGCGDLTVCPPLWVSTFPQNPNPPGSPEEIVGAVTSWTVLTSRNSDSGTVRFVDYLNAVDGTRRGTVVTGPDATPPVAAVRTGTFVWQPGPQGVYVLPADCTGVCEWKWLLNNPDPDFTPRIAVAGRTVYLQTIRRVTALRPTEG